MPRLTEQQVMAGLLHPHPEVRSDAANYFTWSHYDAPDLMATVAAGAKKCGLAGLFPYPWIYSRFPGSAQNADSIRWAIESLKTTRPAKDEEFGGLQTALSDVIASSPWRVVAPFFDELTALKSFAPRTPVGRAFEHRRRISSLSTEEIWNEFRTACEKAVASRHGDDEAHWDAQVSLIAMMIGESHPSLADRVLEQLRTPFRNDDDDANYWYVSYAVDAAGELRLKAAIPTLVELIRLDDDVLTEAALANLSAIGGDEVVSALREAGRDDAAIRSPGSNILERIHTDNSLQTLLAWLAETKDFDDRMSLAQSAVLHFSTEANEAARALLAPLNLASRDLHDLAPQLRDQVVCAAALMNEDFPELPKWRSEMQRDQRRRDALRAKFDRSGNIGYANAQDSPSDDHVASDSETFRRIEPRTGPNEPCPCGSGKKFKKCCKNKQNV